MNLVLREHMCLRHLVRRTSDPTLVSDEYPFEAGSERDIAFWIRKQSILPQIARSPGTARDAATTGRFHGIRKQDRRIDAPDVVNVKHHDVCQACMSQNSQVSRNNDR